jgi:hypothetical protein
MKLLIPEGLSKLKSSLFGFETETRYKPEVVWADWQPRLFVWLDIKSDLFL